MVWKKYMRGCREWSYTIGWLVTDGLKEVHERLQGVRVHPWVTDHWWLAGSKCPLTQEDLHVKIQHCESLKSCLVWISCEFLLFWSIQFDAFSNIICCVIEELCLFLLYVWCCHNMNSLSMHQYLFSQHNRTPLCSDIPATCFSCQQPS